MLCTAATDSDYLINGSNAIQWSDIGNEFNQFDFSLARQLEDRINCQIGCVFVPLHSARALRSFPANQFVIGLRT